MLIVMEDGDIGFRFQTILYLETARCRNILQVYSTEGWRDNFDQFNNLIHILSADANRESLNSREGLKKNSLTLHYRHCCPGAYISKAQHSTSVRYYGYQVGLAGQIVYLFGFL